MLPVAGEQLGQRLLGVTGAQVDGLGVIVEDPAAGVEVALAHHRAERLSRQRGAVGRRGR